MLRHIIMLGLIGAIAGCQNNPTPAQSISACRAISDRFDSSLRSGDRAAYQASIFCADETELKFASALFDFYQADKQLDLRGSQTFAGKWSDIKSKAEMKSPSIQSSNRPIVLLGESTALIRAGGGDNTDLYLIRTGPPPENRWKIQAASLFDPRQPRE